MNFDFEDKQYFIRKVTGDIITKAQQVYNKAFRKALENGCILRKGLDRHMREQGIWNEEKEGLYQDLVKKLAELEYRLNKGGIKLSEAKEDALKLSDLRAELVALISQKSAMDSHTAEGQAENERFNYFVSQCCMDYLTQKPVFSSLENYLEQAETKLAYSCASNFAEFMYGIKKDYDETLTEVKFLKRFKFLDEKGRLINKDGKLVDREGNYINEDGYRVDQDGNRIDINNNPVLEGTVDTVEFIEG